MAISRVRMKFEDIEKEWAIDSEIDRSDLGKAALDISSLHSKYFKILHAEKRNLYLLVEKKAELEHNLESWFLKTMTAEERLAANLPDFLDKKVLKSDVDRHIARYPDIVQLNLKIGIQTDKIEFLKDIIKSIHNRSFIIKDAISWLMFTQGQN